MKIQEKIKSLKKKFSEEGFFIIGVFGSFAKGTDTEESDIDILYEVDKKFVDTYGGFGSVSRLEEIKTELKEKTGRGISFAAKNSLNKTGRKYILNNVSYI